MRAVVQRVSEASVTLAAGTESEQVVGRIGRGLLVLLGVATGDESSDARTLAEKVVGLRIFPDETGRMNRSLAEIGGELLVVSQFTLLGDCRKGRRPSFTDAADPAEARRLYLMFVEAAGRHPIRIATGQFQADMAVALVNDGPVTLLLDSRRTF